MGEYAIFDPSSGARVVEGSPAHSGLFQPGWAPGAVESDDPHETPFDTGDKPSFGPTPENIVTRSAETIGNDSTDADFCAADSDDDVTAETLADTLDGGDVPQNAAYEVGDDSGDDEGETPPNIVVDEDADTFDDDYEGDDDGDDCEDRSSDYGDQEAACDEELEDGEDCTEERSARVVYSSGPAATADALRNYFGVGPFSRSKLGR